MKQAITSAATSLNQVPGVFLQVPRILHKPDYWSSLAEILDYGGGAWDALTDRLAELGVRNLVYDPFNRAREHNELIERLLRVRGAEAAICANVLNVIREPPVRQTLLEHIRQLTLPDAPIFISCHKGNGTSRGQRTTKGWQANKPTKSYLREIKKVFPSATLRGGLILARSSLP